MTTFTDFVPSILQAFAFQATLDGQQYNVTVTANLWRSSGNVSVGGGYYVNLFAGDGTLIVSRALVGSAIGVEVASLSWKAGKVTVTTQEPHGYKLGRITSLTLSGATPDAYNGLFLMLATGPNTLTYVLTTNPGAATIPGTLSYDVNLIGGVADSSDNFFTSTLVYRTPNRQFEVNP